MMAPFARLGGLWLALVTGWPRAILLVLLALVCAAAVGIRDFRLDASADSLLLDDDPALRELREVNGEYSLGGDFMIATWQPQGDPFAPQQLADLRALVEDLRQLEGVSAVLSLLDAVIFPEEELSLGRLVEEMKILGQDSVDPGLARRAVTQSPIFRNYMISPQGDVSGILVSVAPVSRESDALITERYRLRDSGADPARLAQVEARIAANNQDYLGRSTRLVAQAREVVRRHTANGAQVHLGGPPLIIADMVDAVRQDLWVFGIAALGVFGLILSLLLRRLLWVVLPLSASMLTVGAMLGLLGLIGWEVTVVSSNFVALVMILSLSLGVHLVVRHRELSSRLQVSDAELARATATQMFLPCAFASLTTAVAFGSLLVAGIKPVIEFGRMMMLGMAVAMAVVFTLIPAALTLGGKGRRVPAAEETQKPGMLGGALAWLALRPPWMVIGLAVGLGLLMLAGLTRLQVDNRFIDYFRQTTEIYRGMELIDTRLGGTVPMDVVLRAPASWTERGSFDAEEAALLAEEDEELAELFGSLEEDAPAEEPDALQDSYWMTTAGIEQLRRVQRQIEAVPGIGKVISVLTTVRTGEQLRRGPLNDLERAVMVNALPAAIREQLFAPYLSADGHSVRLSTRVVESTRDLRRAELLDRVEQAVQRAGVARDRFHVIGVAVLYSNTLQSLYGSLQGSLVIVLAAVLLMLLVLFRSFKVALLATSPNLLAALIVLGCMGWFGLPLDIMTVMVASISIGIAVDNSIHYSYRYRSEVQSGRDWKDALYRSHATIGRGIYFTSMTIIGGFLIFLLSYFIPTILFGALTSLAMVMGLVGSMTLLPALYLYFRPFKVPAGAGDAEGTGAAAEAPDTAETKPAT